MWRIIFVFFQFAIFQNAAAEGDEEGVTYETIIVETTTQEEFLHTDLPESDVDDAMNLDVGNYTTMRFNYINKQFDKLLPLEKCYDDYNKCLISLVAPTPVCAYNNYEDAHEGFRTANTYCDIFFDNCRRNVRYWKILDNGSCMWLRWEGFKYIEETVRRSLRKDIKSSATLTKPISAAERFVRRFLSVRS